MPIYHKPVRLLMWDFIKEHNITKGEVILRDQVTSWFKEKYPKIKMGTISAHLLKLSTNAPSRIHYKPNPKGEDDLFFQIDSYHYRLFDPENDPSPIYVAPVQSNENISTDTDNNQSDVYPPTGFAYESDLRDFLARNLYLIEPGLHLYEDEGITGIEFPAGGRFIDILAVDQHKNFVVIELKVSKGYDRVIGQLLRYMAWIEKNQADTRQQVRGVIIAREITEDLRLATSKIQDVLLFEYDLSVSLRKIGK